MAFGMGVEMVMNTTQAVFLYKPQASSKNKNRESLCMNV